MIRFSWKVFVLGVLAIYGAAMAVELASYNFIFIPLIKKEFVSENKEFIDGNIHFGPGKLTILAPLAFRTDCSTTYYGCFSWDAFSGADKVVSYTGGSQQEVAVVAERDCVDQRCTKLDQSDVYGYLIGNIEYSEITKNFNTDDKCRELVHSYIVKYRVEFCSRITIGNGKMVSEMHYVKMQNMVFTRLLYSVDFNIYFQILANYGTREVYHLRGW